MGMVMKTYYLPQEDFTLQFSIYSAVLSIIQPFSFLFIRPSGFGLMDKFAFLVHFYIYIFWTTFFGQLFA